MIRSAVPFGGTALLAVLVAAGCVMDEGIEDGEEGTVDEGGDDADGSCALGAPGVYTPYAAQGTYPAGPVDALPWAGVASGSGPMVYPAGMEDFRGYGALPKLVECSNDNGQRTHLDVTSGCLDAVAVGTSYTRGQVRMNSKGLFRAVALGYRPGMDSAHPIKWTDQGIEFRFFHRGRTGDDGYPGIKAFLRYRSENDLYVASWRFDGVVQIQRKLCGQYTALKVLRDFPPPSAGAWHWMRFEAVGDRLTLYLDDVQVLTTNSSSLSWGTAGIRIDSVDAAYLDDWSVYRP